MKRLVQNYPYTDIDPFIPYLKKIFKKLRFLFKIVIIIS